MSQQGNLSYSFIALPYRYFTGLPEGTEQFFRAVTITSLILEFAGIIESVVSIAALCHMRKPFQPLQILITHLAVADMLVLVPGFAASCMEIRILYAGKEEDLSILMCASDVLMDILTHAVQLPLLITSLIVVNQILALTYPLRYKTWVRPRALNVALATIYVTVISICVTFHVVELANASSQQGSCLAYFGRDYFVNSSWYLAVSCAGACLLNLVLNGVLFAKARGIINSTRVPRHVATSSGKLGAAHSDRKLVFTVAILSGTVVLFWLPMTITFALRAYISTRNFQISLAIAIAQSITGALAVFNALCDPLVYGVRLPEVREGYKRLWNKTKYCVNPPSMSNTQTPTVETLSTSL